jgi:hypothetical protein
VFLGVLGAAGDAVGKAAMNAALDTPAPGPRHITVMARSWSGSSQALVSAADELLVGTGDFQSAGADTVMWFEERGAPGRYHVVGAFGFTTSASVQTILQRLHAVEAQLNSEAGARVGGPLKLELKWVEGVHLATPDITLPSPDILGSDWGLSAFLAASEMELAEVCKAGREEARFCNSVARAGRNAPLARIYEVAKDRWLGGKVTPEELAVRGTAKVGEEEILAVAFDALLVLGAAHTALAQDPHADTFQLIDHSIRAVAARTATQVVPVTAELPEGPAAQRVVVWLDALRRAASANRMAPRRAVVYEVRGRQVHGALVGMHSADGAMAALLVEDKVSLREGAAAPGALPTWAVALRLTLPSGQPPR